MRLTVEQLQNNHDAALSQLRLEVERTRYEAECQGRSESFPVRRSKR
jgi:hypothetical protein